ncbi:MAG: hypothetical protein U0230_25685 [Polyangiales bacterium]
MKNPVQRFYEFLDHALWPTGRVLLALSVIPLALAIKAPLWHYAMEAPQYPDGLYFDIYTYRLEGGNEGQHIDEINVLNHYIGMQPIHQSDIPDLGIMPFAMGLLILITLRVAAIGNVRDLVDHMMIVLYTLGFFGFRFVYMLYTYGHELNPEAPVKIPPFTPVVIGTNQIANFTVHSLPRIGTYYLLAYGGIVVGVTLWHLIAARMQAARKDREEERRVPSEQT